MEDLKRAWDKIIVAKDGLQNVERVPEEGSWGILYESSI